MRTVILSILLVANTMAAAEQPEAPKPPDEGRGSRVEGQGKEMTSQSHPSSLATRPSSLDRLDARVLWPLFGWVQGEGRERIHVFPFYWYGSSPEASYLFIPPFYGSEQSPESSAEVLFPLFGWVDGRRTWYASVPTLATILDTDQELGARLAFQALAIGTRDWRFPELEYTRVNVLELDDAAGLIRYRHNPRGDAYLRLLSLIPQDASPEAPPPGFHFLVGESFLPPLSPLFGVTLTAEERTLGLPGLKAGTVVPEGGRPYAMGDLVNLGHWFKGVECRADRAGTQLHVLSVLPWEYIAGPPGPGTGITALSLYKLALLRYEDTAARSRVSALLLDVAQDRETDSSSFVLFPLAADVRRGTKSRFSAIVPFWRYRNEERQVRASGLFPFVWASRKGERESLAVLPLFSTCREGERYRFSLLGPLFRYERDAEERQLRILGFLRIPL